MRDGTQEQIESGSVEASESETRDNLDGSESDFVSDSGEKEDVHESLFQEDLMITKATCNRPLGWVSEHILPMDWTKRWITHNPENGIITEDDLGVVTLVY